MPSHAAALQVATSNRFRVWESRDDQKQYFVAGETRMVKFLALASYQPRFSNTP